jgi:hypothetical protein
MKSKELEMAKIHSSWNDHPFQSTTIHAKHYMFLNNDPYAWNKIQVCAVCSSFISIQLHRILCKSDRMA